MSTRNTGPDYQAYVYAIREELAEQLEILSLLEQKLSASSLSRIERAAAECCIQVVVQIAIGCAKHVLKKGGQSAPSEAAVAMLKAYEMLELKSPAQHELKGAAGMRNVIVHDYLSLDWPKIELVIKQGEFRKVQTFVESLCDYLLLNALPAS